MSHDQQAVTAARTRGGGRAMTEKAPLLLPPWRCWKCRALIARVVVEAGSVVEIRCSHCNAVNVIDKREKPAA